MKRGEEMPRKQHDNTRACQIEPSGENAHKKYWDCFDPSTYGCLLDQCTFALFN